MPYTEAQLLDLVSKVEKEFAVELAKAEGEPTLAKSEAAAIVIEKAEDSGYSAEDHAAMHSMYKSMTKGELKAHQESISKAISDGDLAKADGCGGEMAANQPKGSPGPKSEASETPQPVLNKTETGKIESNEPKGSPGAKSEASETPQPVLNKAEIKEQKPANAKGPESPASHTPQPVLNAGPKGDEMNKSDADLLKSEIDKVKAENSDLKKNLENVASLWKQFVDKNMPAPTQKAITSVDVIAKSEGSGEVTPMTKAEVTAVLLRKSQDPTLAKSDRELINAFYLNSAGIETISHLLK